MLAKALNTRFVVTTPGDDPLNTYAFHVVRGDGESRIMIFKNALAGGRLSVHRFWVDAFRHFLHAADYWLLDTFRCRLTDGPRLLKIG